MLTFTSERMTKQNNIDWPIISFEDMWLYPAELKEKYGTMD